MSGKAALGPEAGAVSAGLHYTIDTGVKPVNETFGPNNIRRRVSGEHDVRQMTIRDGRPLADEFDLEVTGFEFVEHRTQVRDFFDPEELKRVYYPEVEALVKKISGASRVVVFDHTLRSGDEAEREAKLVREPVLNVHNDYTEWSGPQRVRELLPDEAEDLLRRRFAIIQVWRAINQPIQSNPLAIADARSLLPADLIRAERRYPHRVGETYRIGYNPDHRWFYFPRMRRDEALVFKVFESAKDGRARFTAHSSFNDPNTPEGAPPRQSIEARTLAFFAPGK
ncbi:MAG TPA: CmcJ/NvfI family oxidoreductase [Burkholderiales bacterium]|nr:CmcJ/NvfI family oxidoreductase [Burkholderiales bacterium]